MGVPTTKLVYDFLRKNNFVLSGQGKKIPLVDVIAYLNEFQEIWFNNTAKEAELNQEASNELRRYIKTNIPLELESLDSDTVYAKYPAGLHTRLNQIAIVSGIDCCDGITKRIKIKPVQSDDKYPARQGSLTKSSFEFERLVSTIGENGLLIYHDNSCKIDSVVIDYYRKPGELHAPSLEDCEGPYYYKYNGEIITEDTEFEASDIFSDNFISDGASILASADKDDQQRIDIKIKRLLQSRSLYSVRE